MKTSRHFALLSAASLAVAALFVSAAAAAQKPAPHKANGTEVGLASVYSHKFAGKETASGKRFQPNELTAASRKLPLNSEATVTNLETGKSTNVTITDRGPYKQNRVLDLSPKAAESIGVTTKQGVAPVAVKPIAPPPNAKSREAEADWPG